MHQNNPSTNTGILRSVLPQAIVLALLGLYAANCFTPLRLNNDTVRYINIKEWLEAGSPAGNPAAHEFLPYGYVWFLLLLSKLHLAKSFFITFIQLLYFIGSIVFIKKISGATIRLWQLMALCLLSWAGMKFVLTPLSEMQFLFFSMGALYFFNDWQKNTRPVQLMWAIVFCAAAMLTRTIGFLLIPAFIISFLVQHRSRVRSVIIANRVVASILVIVFITAFFVFDKFGISAYLSHHREFFEPLWRDPLAFIGHNLKYHLIDWSAMVLNAPAPKLNMIGTVAMRNTLYLLAGMLSFATMIYFLFRKGGNVAAVVKTYIICYACLIFCWPLFEPRLWLPIMPLCIAILLQQQRIFTGLAKYLFSAYMVVYALVGLTALGYYTHTSFNKKVFAVKQDAAIWRNEYEVHFFGKPLSDTATVVRAPIVRILKKYD